MPQTELPTGTVTLLFTDIEGSTRRWEALPAAMASALAAHDDLLRFAIEANGGHVFKTVGDAFCAAFADAGDGLRACLVAQRSLSATDWGEVGHVRVRMALHTGTPEHRDADYFGPPVNRVARLLATGFGGQVLVSATAAERIASRLPAEVTLLDLGAHRLKDLLQPERIYQVAAPGLDETFPPLKSLDRQPHNLPAQPTPLVGRDLEVAAARSLLEDGTRLVTLTGPGGTGKTRLGLQIAAELVDGLRDGAWFVGLAPLTDAALVVGAIAAALGVRETGHEPLEATLLEYLAAKELVLLLDNFEHVTAAAPLVGRILAQCPTVQILVTSRAVLRVYGEREVAVPPLGLPNLKRLPPLVELAEVAAVELFVERAQAVKPGFTLDEATARPVAELVVKLEGLPLAIELAAARVRILNPAQLLARLSSRLALLTGGAADRDDRQRTLRGAIAWSHDLLPDSQRVLFRRLAVFTGGATLEELEAVADPDFALDALDGIEALVTQSLLRQEEHPDGPRFFMLETIREYATEQLEASGEAAAIRGAHAACYLALAETAEPHLTGAGQETWLHRLEAEHDNLRAALSWFIETGGPDEELRLAGALWRFWDAHGHFSEGRSWLTQALNRAERAPAPLRAKALDGLGAIASAQGDLADAVTAHEAALALSRSVGDETGMARSTGYAGLVACYEGEFERALPLLEESLGHYRAVNDDRGVAGVLHYLSEVALQQGDYERATALGTESLAIYRARGEANSIAKLVLHLGRLAFHAEDFEGAARLFEESLSNLRAIGDASAALTAQVMLARSCEGLGKLDDAVGLLEDAIPAIRDIGDKGNTAFALYSLAHIAQTRDDHDRARKLYVESLTIYRQIGEQVGIGECLQGIAEVLCASGSEADGAILLGAAEASRAATGVPLTPAGLVLHERAVVVARSRLGEPGYGELIGLGNVMSADQAAAEVAALA